VNSASYAGATSNDPKKYVSYFHRLECSNKKTEVDLCVLIKVVEEVNFRILFMGISLVNALLFLLSITMYAMLGLIMVYKR
jgi:hypothetical protein